MALDSFDEGKPFGKVELISQLVREAAGSPA